MHASPDVYDEGHRVLLRLVRRLDELSEQLAKTNRELEPKERAYQDFIDAYELTLYREAEAGASKVPSADLRLKLALSAFRERDPETLSAYYELTARQGRLEKRCAHLGKQIDGWRSISSYEKTIAEVG